MNRSYPPKSYKLHITYSYRLKKRPYKNCNYTYEKAKLEIIYHQTKYKKKRTEKLPIFM